MESHEFTNRNLDTVIRRIFDKARDNYFQNGETIRGIPGEVKKIIEANIDKV